LVVAAALVPTIARPRRIIMCGGALVLLLAVLDSLDGRQDILPSIVILLTVWALIYADTTIELLQAGRPTTLRRWLAISLGIVSTIGYLGAAGYYLIVNATVVLVDSDHHPLFGVAIVLSTLLRWLGEIPPYGGPLTGSVRICAACGLRNIPERQTCKRCQTPLGPVEHVQ
jgi:hypothetical protein